MMPKAKQASASFATNLLILTYGARRVIVPRPNSYDDAIAAAHRSFHAPKHFIRLKTDFLGDESAEISPEAWDQLSPLLEKVEIALVKDDPIVAKEAPISKRKPVKKEESVEPPPVQKRPSKKFNIQVSTSCGLSYLFTISPNTRMGKIVASVEDQMGVESGSGRLTYKGAALTNETASGLELGDGDVINYFALLRGGKPVIYLFPPAGPAINVRVELNLVPQWSFSAIYPSTTIEKSVSSPGGQAIAWDVVANPGGNLIDKASGSEIAYLFWEAESNPHLKARLDTAFDPLTADLAPSDSVLLPIEKVPAYLDAALISLGLHVEARTSFITYWLPSLLKHTHVALRFVPQAAYERAAPLHITPTPDVTTRVFMLFKGVIDLTGWDKGSKAAQEGAERWRDIVGVRVEDLRNNLIGEVFRVLEWGGMEVKR